MSWELSIRSCDVLLACRPVPPTIELTSLTLSRMLSSADSCNGGPLKPAGAGPLTAEPVTFCVQPDNTRPTATATAHIRGSAAMLFMRHCYPTGARTGRQRHFFGLSLPASVDNAATNASCGTS